MIIIGLTGGIGSGKTFVGKFIMNLDFPFFNSDKEAKKIMIENKEVIEQIKQVFGEKAYQDGSLNREYLAEQIFHNPKLKKKMNAIVHPAVHKAFDEFCKIHSDKKAVFNEAAILFETGRYKDFDYNILVVAPEETRIERVMKRDNTTKEEVLSRINNQWDDNKKADLADYIIINDGERAIKPQIEDIFSELGIL
ncbi:MAG: dephospho-CoA kinase [Brumimicrobium sp.]